MKGLTGRRWRRRWFSTDKNGRLYYYQKNNNTLPRGYVAEYPVTIVSWGKLVEQGPFAVNHNSSLHNLYRKWVPSFSTKIAGIVCVDNVSYDWLIGSLGSLRTADAFPVVGNSVAIFRRERCDDRKCVCCSHAIPLDTIDYS